MLISDDKIARENATKKRQIVAESLSVYPSSNFSTFEMEISFFSVFGKMLNSRESSFTRKFFHDNIIL